MMVYKLFAFRGRIAGHKGFTLLELSIVLVIVALITAMATTSGIAVLSNARQSATAQRMSAIDQALTSFAASYNRIPCPADLTITAGNTNYGVEAANQWSCTGGTPAANFSRNNSSGTTVEVAEGAVPAVTLGVPTDLMYDGWGNQFRYAVDVSMTKTGMFQMTPAGALCGAITIQDTNGNARSGNGTTSAVNPYPNGAIYALISHGPNGHGAYSKYGTVVNAGSTNANEQTNCHCTSAAAASAYYPTYIQADISGNTSGTNIFDDVVTYKERWQLQTPWDRIGTVCPALYLTVSTASSGVERFDMNGHDLGSAVNSAGTNAVLNAEWSTTVDTTGNIWVADTGHHRLQQYTSSGTYMQTIGGFATAAAATSDCSNCSCMTTLCLMCTGSSPFTCKASSSLIAGGLKTPAALAFDNSGNLWVADQGNNRVDEYNAVGIYYQSIGPMTGATGNTNLTFNNPYSTAVDGNGNIWVADTSNNRVQEFSPLGVWLNAVGAGYNGVAGTLGSAGTVNGALNSPYSIFFDTANNLWVADNGNYRVQEFSNNGSWIQTIGPTIANAGCTVSSCNTGSSNYRFSNSSGIAIDALGDVWVMDSGNSRLQEYSSSGVYLGTFASGNAFTKGFGSFSEPGLAFHGGLVR